MRDKDLSRAAMWPQSGKDYEVLVVGGGIMGCGAARELARLGIRTALVEQNDFAYGTSSRSSKLVHGGLRYLNQYRLHLVFEAVSERRVLQRIAPHLVKPLAFLFPIYRDSPISYWLLRIGLWLYDLLSLFRSPKLHRVLSKQMLKEEEPSLLATNLRGIPLYYDCSTDDARLTLENALDAAAHGATVLNWSRATSFLWDEQGKCFSVELEDRLSHQRQTVKAAVVLNATGPWTDLTRQRRGTPDGNELLYLTKGVHLVLPQKKLPLHHAVALFHPRDQRVMFAIPWGEQSYVGTTDTPYHGRPEHVAADAVDIDYLLEAVNLFFPSVKLSKDDVLTTWAGLRPLIRPEEEGSAATVSPSKISREHTFVMERPGFFTVAGGKLTTYRRVAEQITKDLVHYLSKTTGQRRPASKSGSDAHPLPGARDWPTGGEATCLASLRAQSKHGFADEVLMNLLRSYGTRATEVLDLALMSPELGEPLMDGRPEIMAQVDWAVKKEMAQRLDDILMRRTQLFYREATQGIAASRRVADRMAELLGWDQTRKAQELDRYAAIVEGQQQWKKEAAASVA